MITREPSRLKEDFDLLIIGGGIQGAGIARDAALRGFKICLIEKGDFASGTSSKTSKLVHGGLRYLEHGHFKLVREALQERHHLLKIAPHLVHPLPFLLPIYRGEGRRPWKIRLGLRLYDRLAGGRNIHAYEKLSPHQMTQEIPDLKKSHLQTSFHYYDAQMNDSRVCLENILSAVENGASCVNYMKAIQLIEKESRICGVLAQDRISNEKIEIRAKLTINATGPWLDQLLQTHRKNSVPRLRLTKGIHLVLPRLSEKALLFFTEKDGRVFFCIPWNKHSIVGTTDTDFSGNPDSLHAEPDEVLYLLNEIQRLMPERHLTPHDIISTFAGLRPLVRQEGHPTSSISREYKIEETLPGLINVLGGKFTTYRSLAENVVNQVSKQLHLHQDQSCQTALLPLPGGGTLPEPHTISRDFALPMETVQHLIQTYGSRTQDVAQMAKDFGLKEKICPYHPYLKAEVVYAFTHEMAQTLEDFLTRRTLIRYSPCRGLDCLETTSKILLELSILSSEELEEQKVSYQQKVHEDLSATLSL